MAPARISVSDFPEVEGLLKSNQAWSKEVGEREKGFFERCAAGQVSSWYFLRVQRLCSRLCGGGRPFLCEAVGQAGGLDLVILTVWLGLWIGGPFVFYPVCTPRILLCRNGFASHHFQETKGGHLSSVPSHPSTFSTSRPPHYYYLLIVATSSLSPPPHLYCLLSLTSSSSPSMHHISEETCSQKQAPPYLWFGCCDSRVPETVVLDQKPGALFVHVSLSLSSSPTFLARHVADVMRTIRGTLPIRLAHVLHGKKTKGQKTD